MATDKHIEYLAGTLYPRAMRHLQQLIMDAEKCAKTKGKTSFFGADKFESSMEKFTKTLAQCSVALVEDGAISDPNDAISSLHSINSAMCMLRDAYSSWPLAFKFWDLFYSGTQESAHVNADHPQDSIVKACPNCSQRLRIPKGRILDVTCPSCRTTFRS